MGHQDIPRMDKTYTQKRVWYSYVVYLSYDGARPLPVLDSAYALAENVELASCVKSKYSGRWSRTIAIHLAFISFVVETR